MNAFIARGCRTKACHCAFKVALKSGTRTRSWLLIISLLKFVFIHHRDEWEFVHALSPCLALRGLHWDDGACRYPLSSTPAFVASPQATLALVVGLNHQGQRCGCSAVFVFATDLSHTDRHRFPPQHYHSSLRLSLSNTYPVILKACESLRSRFPRHLSLDIFPPECWPAMSAARPRRPS